VASAVAVGLAVAISEYGLVTAAAAITLLVFLGRFRRVLPVAAGAAIGYGVFRAIADASVREDTRFTVQGTKLFTTPWAIPPRLGTGLWYTLFGAYGRAADQLRPEWSSRSTILALGIALLAAALAVWSCRGPRDPAAMEGGPAAGRALLRRRRSPSRGDVAEHVLSDGLRIRSASRAAVRGLLLLCGIRALLPRYRMIAVGLLGFLAGYTTAVASVSTIREQRTLTEIGDILRKRLGPEGTTTIAVVPQFGGRLDAVEMTAKATRGWSNAEADRIWFERSSDAMADYGDRMRCKPLGSFSVQNERFARPQTRICRIVYVPVSADGKIGELEPYCLEATRTWNVISGCDRSF
jgi:hypothetical protein